MVKKWILCAIALLSIFLFYQRGLPLLVVFNADESPTWSPSHTQEETLLAKQILERPLKFFGLGSQCFVFLSEDEKFVVKICKGSRLRVLFSDEKRKNKESDFSSYALALEWIPKQSQMVFLHLNTTQDLNTTLKVIDPFGIPHFLDADHLAFYIQKKVTPLDEYLKALPKSEAKPFMNKLLTLVKSSCDQGLQIRDISPKNIGVCDDLPMWIDLGRIRKNPVFLESVRQKRALLWFCKRLKKFLKSFDPNFYVLIQQEFEQVFLQEEPNKP